MFILDVVTNCSLNNQHKNSRGYRECKFLHPHSNDNSEGVSED